MLNRHHLAHAALFAVYALTATILLSEGALAHAGCALTVAVIYANMVFSE